MTPDAATRPTPTRPTPMRPTPMRPTPMRHLPSRNTARWQRSQTFAPGSLALALTLVLLGCSGAPEPTRAGRGDRGGTLPAAVPGSSSTASQGTPQTADEAGDPASATPEIAPTPAPTHPPRPQGSEAGGAARDAGEGARDRLSRRAKDDDTLTIIDQREAPRTTSLAEAAQRAREEREKAPQPKIVITNDNLAEYATGELTVATPGTASSSDGEAADEAADGDLGQDEDHWRQGARELRLKLRRAWDEARILEEQIAGLRVRFYAEDDPHLRDSEIKPAWDRALERQRQAEEEVRAYRRELDRFLEEGRRAGALPGWLREGIEHEPEIEEEPEGAEDEEALEGFGRLEPVEPERMENPSRPPL